MAYQISESCINCAACAPECPVDAISEADEKHEIDASLCIDCAACESVCPANAISQA